MELLERLAVRSESRRLRQSCDVPSTRGDGPDNDGFPLDEIERTCVPESAFHHSTVCDSEGG